jgi:hypothetical protein
MGTVASPVFQSCDALTTLNIGDNVQTIPDYAFDGCYGLTTVNFNATYCPIMGSSLSSIFNSCTAFTTLNIGDNVQTIPNYAFAYCYGLAGALTIPNSVTTIGENAFAECTGLTSLSLGNSVTIIGKEAFYECTGLTGSLTIPNFITTIGAGAFYDCGGLTGSLTIPNLVTSIEEYAFVDCGGFTSLSLGGSVEYLGTHAFAACVGLASLTSLAETPPTLGYKVFNEVPTSSPLYVPCGSVEEYQATSDWSAFTYGECVTLGINDIQANSLSIYPNPARDFVTLSGIQSTDKVTITDLSGRTVLVETWRAASLQTQTINVSRLPQGVYLVRVGDKTAKFIKQ